LWEPYLPATWTRSEDGGRTWSTPRELSGVPGRVYDALVREDEILVLEFQNDADYDFCGRKPEEHRYVLHVSVDGGSTFVERSVVPFDILERGYGTLGVLRDGSLIAYVY